MDLAGDERTGQIGRLDDSVDQARHSVGRESSASFFGGGSDLAVGPIGVAASPCEIGCALAVGVSFWPLHELDPVAIGIGDEGRSEAAGAVG